MLKGNLKTCTQPNCPVHHSLVWEISRPFNLIVAKGVKHTSTSGKISEVVTITSKTHIYRRDSFLNKKNLSMINKKKHKKIKRAILRLF